MPFNTLRPRQNGRHFPDDILKCIFLNTNAWISIKISLKFVPKGPINKIPALIQIMAWRRSGDKPLSEPMMVSLLTHICVTRPQWVKWCIVSHKAHWIRLACLNMPFEQVIHLSVFIYDIGTFYMTKVWHYFEKKTSCACGFIIYWYSAASLPWIISADNKNNVYNKKHKKYQKHKNKENSNGLSCNGRW